MGWDTSRMGGLEVRKGGGLFACGGQIDNGVWAAGIWDCERWGSGLYAEEMRSPGSWYTLDCVEVRPRCAACLLVLRYVWNRAMPYLCSGNWAARCGREESAGLCRSGGGCWTLRTRETSEDVEDSRRGFASYIGVGELCKLKFGLWTDGRRRELWSLQVWGGQEYEGENWASEKEMMDGSSGDIGSGGALIVNDWR